MTSFPYPLCRRTSSKAEEKRQTDSESVPVSSFRCHQKNSGQGCLRQQWCPQYESPWDSEKSAIKWSMNTCGDSHLRDQQALITHMGPEQQVNSYTPFRAQLLMSLSQGSLPWLPGLDHVSLFQYHHVSQFAQDGSSLCQFGGHGY